MDESIIPSDYEEEEQAPLPSAISPHCATTKVYVSSEEDEDEFDESGALLGDRGHQRMIRGHKAEATRGDLSGDEAVSIREGVGPKDWQDWQNARLVDPLFGEVLGGVLPVKHRHKSRPCIYKIWCAAESKGYIGQTCWFVQRMSKHRNGDRSNPWKARLIRDAIERMGWGAMEVEKLWEGDEEDKLNEMEEHFVQEHGTLAPNGYNCIDGGTAANRAGRRLRMQEKGTDAVSKQPKGPRPEALNQKQMATWERKREEKWNAMGLSEAEKEKKRHNVAMEAANKKRKRLGLALDDTSFGPKSKMPNYWKGKHGKRLG